MRTITAVHCGLGQLKSFLQDNQDLLVSHAKNLHFFFFLHIFEGDSQCTYTFFTEIVLHFWYRTWIYQYKRFDAGPSGRLAIIGTLCTSYYLF